MKNKMDMDLDLLNRSKYRLFIDGDFDCFMTIIDPSEIGKVIDYLKKDYPDSEIRLQKVSYEDWQNSNEGWE